MLLERGEIIDRAMRIDISNLLANGFGHGHGGIVCAHEEIRAWLRNRGAPVDGGRRRLVQARFADIAGDADDFGRAGVTQIQGLHMMANDRRAVEIGVGEGAIRDHRGWAIGFAAEFTR